MKIFIVYSNATGIVGVFKNNKSAKRFINTLYSFFSPSDVTFYIDKIDLDDVYIVDEGKLRKLRSIFCTEESSFKYIKDNQNVFDVLEEILKATLNDVRRG